jgi:hypothetical protein
MVFAGVAMAGPAGTARAASDDAVDPSFYNPGGQNCAPLWPRPDPLGSWGGAPGLTAYIMPANAGCNTAIWSDYGFTKGRTCSVDVYVSATANANVTYHFEQDTLYPTGINTWTATLNQRYYYGWVRIVNVAWSIRSAYMYDSAPGGGQYIGAAGMDFTCH